MGERWWRVVCRRIGIGVLFERGAIGGRYTQGLLGLVCSRRFKSRPGAHLLVQASSSLEPDLSFLFPRGKNEDKKATQQNQETN